MDMDFAVSCPLVRRWRLVSGSCSSTRTFDPCFFRTPPRGGSPCIITRPSPPSGWPEDFHLQAAEHAQHTTKPLARRTLRVVCWSGVFRRRGDCPRLAVEIASSRWMGRITNLTSFRPHRWYESTETPLNFHSSQRPPQTPAASFSRLNPNRPGPETNLLTAADSAGPLPIEI